MARGPSLSNLRKRVGRLSADLTSAGLGGVVIAPGPNLSYYTGVRAHLFERPFLLLVEAGGGAHLLVPKLEAGPFRASIPLDLHLWDDSEGPSRAVSELVKGIETTKVWGCEGTVPFGYLDRLERRGLRVEPADTILQSIRAVKEPTEIETTKKSAELLSRSILRIPEFLRAGMTEKELARLVMEDALSRGVDEVDPMVQSGTRAADPHIETSAKKIRRGEAVVVDVVSYFGGYAADITRTFVLGNGGEAERIYEKVLAAQERAIEGAAAGVTTGSIDQAARGSLEEEGLSRYFIHRTGHGLGLEVHEAPYIVAGGRDRVEAGMVFTVEPGVYIAGKLGVRIEDDLVAKAHGAEVITRRVPKEFGWWK